MTMRMLIDARHQEETRVAVLKGNRIEEFDFESAEHKQIKGNIYLAKVTRVEPSLQAAFVDFGGNRHGFLAFSEIHPDYYQIPKEDREALLAEEAAHAEEEAALRAIAEGEEDFVGDDELGETLADDFAGTSHDSFHADDDHGLTEVDTAEKDEVATIEDGQIDNAFDHEGEEAAEAEGGEDRLGAHVGATGDLDQLLFLQRGHRVAALVARIFAALILTGIAPAPTAREIDVARCEGDRAAVDPRRHTVPIASWRLHLDGRDRLDNSRLCVASELCRAEISMERQR